MNYRWSKIKSPTNIYYCK